MPRGNITPLCARAGLLMVLGLYGWDLGPMVWLASLCDSRLRNMGCLAPGVFGFLILLFVVLVGSLSLLGFLMLLVNGGFWFVVYRTAALGYMFFHPFVFDLRVFIELLGAWPGLEVFLVPYLTVHVPAFVSLKHNK